MQETSEIRVQCLGQEDPLEEGMATHSNTLAWRIPWTEEPAGLGYSPWGCKESDMTEATCMHAYNPLFKIGKYILLVDVLEHSQEMKEQSIHIYIRW